MPANCCRVSVDLGLYARSPLSAPTMRFMATVTLDSNTFCESKNDAANATAPSSRGTMGGMAVNDDNAIVATMQMTPTTIVRLRKRDRSAFTNVHPPCILEKVDGSFRAPTALMVR